MARRDRYGLSQYQENALMQARAIIAPLIEIPVISTGNGIELPFGKNTEANEIATEIVRDIEELLGY